MRLYYKITGEGQPVIILHGLFGMSDNWQSFARNLSSRGFSCCLVDLRNHGRSPHSEVFSYKAMAEDVAELIDDLHLDKPVVAGHSMGGKAGLQLLADNPAAISKLIVVDIAPYAYPLHHDKILSALFSVDLNKIKTRKEAEKILAQTVEDAGTQQFLLKNLYWATPDRLDWRFNLSAINDNIEEVGAAAWPAAPVYTPVLFVSGENSAYIDTRRTEEIRHFFPRAEFVTIKNSGHWVQADQPELLLETMLRFL